MASRMEISFPGGVAVDALIDGVLIRTDQPQRYGGGGTAPAPFELFLASIGTCAGYYALRFCQERQIPTEGMSVSMAWERSPATKLVSAIKIEIGVPPGVPEKYRAAIIRAADQCAVKRHLAEAPSIEVVAV